MTRENFWRKNWKLKSLVTQMGESVMPCDVRELCETRKSFYKLSAKGKDNVVISLFEGTGNDMPEDQKVHYDADPFFFVLEPVAPLKTLVSNNQINPCTPMERTKNVKNLPSNLVSIDFLTNYGISQEVINKGIYRNKKGISDQWQFIGEPYGKKQIVYSSIPLATRKKLPTENEIRDHAIIGKLQEEQVLQQDEAAQMQARLNQAAENYTRFMPIYLKHGCDKRKVIELAQWHSILNECLELTESGSKHRKNIQKVFTICQTLPLSKKLADYRSFSRKLVQAATNGIESTVVHKQTGNSNRKKTTPFHFAQIQNYAAHPKQYSSSIITHIINSECKGLGLSTVSHSWVKTQMAKPEIKNLIKNTRYGEKKASDTLYNHLPRTNALFPADQWQVDGTPLQMWCMDKEGKRPIRLNMFAVIDTCTKKIVGVDFSISEDKFNIINSLHNAVSMHGHLPFEIVHDNFSANRTHEIQGLKDKMSQFGVTFRAAKVGNAQDKNTIERYFNTFQTRFCKLIDGYIGEGITSKNPNGRPDAFYLQKVKDKAGYPNMDTLKFRVLQLIDVYNNEILNNEGSYSEKYAATPKPNGIKLEPLQYSQLFYNSTKVTVNKCMVKLTVHKQDYWYNVYMYADKLRLNGVKVLVRYDENDLDKSVHLFDLKTDSYICECRLIKQPHMALANQTPADVLEIQKHASHVKGFKNFIADEKVKITRAALEFTGLAELPYTDPLDLYKDNLNSRESSEFETLLRLSDIDENKVQPYKQIPVNTGYNDNRDIEDLSRGNYDKMGKPSLKQVIRAEEID